MKERIKLLQKVNKDPKFWKFIDLCVIKIRSINALTATAFIAGCGGSHSDADHFAGELLGRYKKNRHPYRAECLSGASSGVITCIANDFGFEHIISRQLQAKAAYSDGLFVFSTSGNSPSIINALQESQNQKIISLAFLGKGGGKAKKLADAYYIVPSNNTAHVQEIHTIMMHEIMERLEK